MTGYAFTTRWRVAAPIDRVFETIADVDAWPLWWRGVDVTMIERTDDGHGNGGIGSRYAFVFRSRLPYSLRFEMVLTQLARPSLLGGAASGELTGTGRWSLVPRGVGHAGHV